jgi:hypothetical protein
MCSLSASDSAEVLALMTRNEMLMIDREGLSAGIERRRITYATPQARDCANLRQSAGKIDTPEPEIV